MSEDGIEPIECTPVEMAKAMRAIAMDHLGEAFAHLEKYAGYRNHRIQYERRPGGDGWARITLIPEPEPGEQIPCGLCCGGRTLDGSGCPICEGLGTIHKAAEFTSVRLDGHPRPPGR